MEPLGSNISAEHHEGLSTLMSFSRSSLLIAVAGQLMVSGVVTTVALSFAVSVQ